MYKKESVEKYIGEIFGYWTVVSYNEQLSKEKRETLLNCVCKCGTTKPVYLKMLKKGKSKSCGCMRREKKTTHGLEQHSMYNIWRNQYNRCNNRKNKNYNHYGGRGIECTWTLEEACVWYDENPKPSKKHSLDRIDNNGHYEVSNVRWATSIEQNNNRRPRTFSTEDVGVYKLKYSYTAEIGNQNNNRIRKNFKTEEEAREWRRKMVEQINSENNLKSC